jgi:hypothetical protein
MAWTWRLADPDGAERPAPESFPNQSDAESWLGENWRRLAESGVSATSLYDGDALVYGPMPLSED